MASTGITAVEGLELGHHTLLARPTGCTVIVSREGAVGGVDVRGGSPGSRETALLDPVNSVERVNAVVLAGGSAFGLAVADGVMRYLDEQGVGYRVGEKVVPIVVGAILYDLGLEGAEKIRPGPECGYAAAATASRSAAAEGSVGAGAGATVGKMRGMQRAMKGGFGTASFTLSSGLTVAAAVAVNAVGDVVDPATGEVVAGARSEDGREFVDMRRVLRGGDGGGRDAPAVGGNTTIGVVATNALLTKAQATKVAQMGQDGLARTIYPAHTPRDGDTVFSLATGVWDGEIDVTLIGALAADAMAEAILRAVRQAEGLDGIPGASEMGR
ncbi:MAG: P1 family peptidase [Gemmatimonadota bacterium]|nr:P1 family peptidase [Gemmatimonadota bacterium]